MPKYIKHVIAKQKRNHGAEKNRRNITISTYLKLPYTKKGRKGIIKKESKIKSRCILSGRAKGYYSMFRLGRHMIKKMLGMGKLPGIRLGSW